MDTAPDGSPVAIYRALPVEPEFTPVLQAIHPRATVLDLGCGVGRLANVLASRGHDVTGVDESSAMLAKLDPRVHAVQGRIEDLALGRRFDAVVLASHLVNVADGALRTAVLRAAADHLQPSGRIFLEHYEPASMRDTESSDTTVGDVRISFRVLARRGDEFDAVAVYWLNDASWEQRFTAVVLDDDRLDAQLALAGLRRAERLARTWITATSEHGAGASRA